MHYIVWTVFLVTVMIPHLLVKAESPADVCRLPKDPGPAKGYFPRFFYNETSRRCESFIYGGAIGNGNNFNTVEECSNTCICRLPKDPGPAKGYFPRFFYNETSRRCESFIYGGAIGNGNNFNTVEECSNTCICRLPKDPGPAKGYFPRFFYNETSRRCESFIYGGAIGNGNNFNTVEECSNTCICSFPRDIGGGSESLKRFYYDGKKCRPFKFTGCGGNANKFTTKKDCRETCICSPPNTDKCSGFNFGFFYNYTSNQCYLAVQGCGSVRFKTPNECYETCPPITRKST